MLWKQLLLVWELRIDTYKPGWTSCRCMLTNWTWLRTLNEPINNFKSPGILWRSTFFWWCRQRLRKSRLCGCRTLNLWPFVCFTKPVKFILSKAGVEFVFQNPPLTLNLSCECCKALPLCSLTLKIECWTSFLKTQFFQLETHESAPDLWRPILLIYELFFHFWIKCVFTHV